jgi:para-aminobenzoate synthetase
MQCTDIHTAADTLLAAVKRLQSRQSRPCFIAIDGRSGSGKSTLATHLKASFGTSAVSVLEGDSFYRGGSAALWDNRTAAQNAGNAIHGQKLGAVIHSLQTKGMATWSAFDWHSEQWDTDKPPYEVQPRNLFARSLVIVEGVYTAAPALCRYYDYRVLLDLPPSMCSERTRLRDGDHFCPQWSERWSAAESFYFRRIGSPARFDFVFKSTTGFEKSAEPSLHNNDQLKM